MHGFGIAGGNSPFGANAANPFSGSTTSVKPRGWQTTGNSYIFAGNSAALSGVTSSAFSPSSALGVSSLSKPFGTNSNASPLAGGSSVFGTLNSTATNTTKGFGGGSFNFGVKPTSSGFNFGTTSQQQSQPEPFTGFGPSNSSVAPSTLSSSPFSSFTGFNSSNSKTPALSSTSNGIGSRVAAYNPTCGKDEKQATIILQSISAMPAYAHKSQEELRWEDYQSGDKGGPRSFSTAWSNSNVKVNGLFAPKPNLWQTSPSTQFAPSSTASGSLQTSSASVFSPSNANNPFAPSGKQGTTSSPLFNPFSISSAATATSSSSSAFGPGSSSTFGSFSISSATSGSLQTNSPSIFDPSNTNKPFASSGKQGATSSPLFNPFNISSATTATSCSSSAFGPASSSIFGPFNTSSAPTTNPRPPFNAQTGDSNSIAPDPFSNLFAPKSTLSVSQPSQTTPASNVQTGVGNSFAPPNPFTNSFAPQNPPPLSQPTQNTPPFTPGNLSESQSAATRYPFSSGGMLDLNQPVKPSISGIFSPSNSAPVVPTKTLAPARTHSAPLSTSQGSAAVQSAPTTNPFGTLPPLPEVCIGTRATTPTTPPPSVRQYGIASMPAVQRAATTVRISSLFSVRNLTRGLHRPLIRKYDPNQNEHRAAFFTKEPLKAPKADTVLLPRENPRALVIRTMDQKPLRTAIADNVSPLKDTPTADQDNGKTSEVSSGSITGAEDVYLQKEEWNMKGRAGESATVYDNGDEIMTALPKLRFPDCYTEPSIQELAANERAQPGFCSRVKDFVVGRRGFGNIKFLGETDVRGLDLDALVQINYRDVVVYMDESKKHSIGQGLNKPAEITLFDVRCVNRKTGQPYTEGPKIEKLDEILRKKAEDQGAEFVSYEPVRGEWKFRVKHF